MESSAQKKTAGPTPAASIKEACRALYFLLTAFFSSAPGVNFATFRAAILIVAPVCGLRPLRAFLWETEKVPKPIRATRSPFRRAAVTLSMAVSIAVFACALLISHAPAILSTRSALFIFSPRQVLFRSQRNTGTKGLAEFGKPDGCIFLPLDGMSTVKIRAGSRFRTAGWRIGAAGAIFDRDRAASPVC